MTTRTIVTWPSPVLSQEAEPVPEINDDVISLAQDLVDTMNVSFGAGLAATQIGVLRSVAVIRTGYANLQLPPDPVIGDAVILVNPQLEYVGEDKFTWEEACLSIPEYQGKVRRFKKINLTYTDLAGGLHHHVLEDESAGVIQHETDHLVGKLFVDRMRSKERRLVLMSLRRKIQSERKSQLKFLEILANDVSPSEKAIVIGRPKRKKKPKKKFGKNKKRNK